MSKTLIIRHLPTTLSFEEKEQLLKHFGADKVWGTTKKRNYIFASFSTIEEAKSSLARLHQLEIAGRRLVVEFSVDNTHTQSSNVCNIKTSDTTNKVKTFIKNLNAWNPSLEFYQPPPVDIRYKYPELNSNILVNIIYYLINHKPLYVQTLHLMNKMCLTPPFEYKAEAVSCFKDMFRDLFLDEIVIPTPASEPESELSSDGEQNEKIKSATLLKRKQSLPITRKRLAAVLSSASQPKVKKKSQIKQQTDVFEGQPLQETKKISMVVNQDALAKQTVLLPEVIGELGTFQKEEQPIESVEAPQEKEQPTITKKELIKNRISYSDMKVLPVYKNYHPGQPSMRLYIKNLAKSVTENDLKRIYRLYIENTSEEDQVGFDVRVMQEGRMKGQGFVTFPSVKLAEMALNETNGYLLKERPMVVQFARVANKKPME